MLFLLLPLEYSRSRVRLWPSMRNRVRACVHTCMRAWPRFFRLPRSVTPLSSLLIVLFSIAHSDIATRKSVQNSVGEFRSPTISHFDAKAQKERSSREERGPRAGSRVRSLRSARRRVKTRRVSYTRLIFCPPACSAAPFLSTWSGGVSRSHESDAKPPTRSRRSARTRRRCDGTRTRGQRLREALHLGPLDNLTSSRDGQPPPSSPGGFASLHPRRSRRSASLVSAGSRNAVVSRAPRPRGSSSSSTPARTADALRRHAYTHAAGRRACIRPARREDAER